MPDQEDLLLSYYGDDFTGSTDAMEALAQAGVRTVLFLEPPRPEQLYRFEGVKAVGVAGKSRTLSPEAMDKELPSAFEQLRELGSPIVHYKVCSTFDSSPEIGSIGHAIDIGYKIFSSHSVPVVVGVPALGRYCAFGNLFARASGEGEVHRLDRHPTMQHHPMTPMHESDLRLHLSRQTSKRAALFDILQIAAPGREANRWFATLLESSSEILLMDVLYDEHLSTVGELVWSEASQESPLFAVGSSGIEYALTAHWDAQGKLPNSNVFDPPRTVDQIIAVSGSCSPGTDRQIAWALEQGFVEIPVQPTRLVDPEETDSECEVAVRKTIELISAGRSIILHTCRGPQDPRIGDTLQRLSVLGLSDQDAKVKSGELLGEALGSILYTALQETGVRRAAIAGGDTSSYIARQLGVEAFEMIAPISPGAPLCQAHSPNSFLDGMEIVFKGGQLGKESFFADVLARL